METTSALPGKAPEEAEINESAQYDQPWLTSFARPILIAILVACLDIALLSFLSHFVAFLPGMYIPLLVILGIVAVLIGCSTTTWLAQPSQRGRRTLGYRLAEFALILTTARLAIWFVTATWPAMLDLLTQPLNTLLDGYFIVGAFVVALSWFMATAMTDDLLAMALQPDDLYLARTFHDRWQDTARPVYTDRPAILRRFVGRWVTGGIFLVVLAAGSRFGPGQIGFLALMRQDIAPGVIAAIIIYFLVGLVLISQGQLALLRARWTLHKTPSAASVPRNWPLYALTLIVVIGVGAALLPLGSTFRLAQIIAFVIQTLYFMIFGFFRLLMTLFFLLISWLTGETPQDAPTRPPLPPMTPPALPASSGEFPAWVGGALFWLVAAILLGYAAYIYFSGKGFDFTWLARLWQMLRGRWGQLFGAYQEWRMTRLRLEGAAGLESDGAHGGLPSWLRLRNLNPNQQARYFYLSLLHHAQQAGLPRHGSETPLHYAPRLEERTAQGVDDRAAITGLTQTFMEARYSDKEIDAGQLPELKRAWQRVKGLLQR